MSRENATRICTRHGSRAVCSSFFTICSFWSTIIATADSPAYILSFLGIVESRVWVFSMSHERARATQPPETGGVHRTYRNSDTRSAHKPEVWQRMSVRRLDTFTDTRDETQTHSHTNTHSGAIRSHSLNIKFIQPANICH